MSEQIAKFEDLQCWQHARLLVAEIFTLTSETRLAEEYTVKNQLCRAALSVMSNIAEGFARSYRGDFIRLLDYAQSSTQEVKSLLYGVIDLDLAPKRKVKDIQTKCDEVRRLTMGLLKHVRSSNDPIPVR